MNPIWSEFGRSMKRIVLPEPAFVGLYLENGRGTSHSLGRGLIAPYNPPVGDGVFSPLPHLPFQERNKFC